MYSYSIPFEPFNGHFEILKNRCEMRESAAALSCLKQQLRVVLHLARILVCFDECIFEFVLVEQELIVKIQFCDVRVNLAQFDQ